MNTESTSPTAENINEAIDWIKKTGGAIQDFAIEQAPLYCREVVAWEFWIGISGVALGLFLIAVPLIAVIKFREWIKDDLDDMGIGGFLTLLFSALTVLGGSVTAMSSAPQAIKACVAPRMIIVEHLRGLSK